MVGIVFLHHQTDAITENHLQSFRDWNPNATIVTVSGGKAFPGGYSIHDLPQGPLWEEHTRKWNMQARTADVLLYSWYLNRREHCDRWIVVEWDAYCGMPVEKFFEPVWDFDLVAASTRWRHRDWEWFWFSTVKTLPGDLQPFAMGLVPFCFLMMKDHVLDAICQRVPWEQLGCCNAELRFGTLACAAGFCAATNPLAGWNVSWRELPDHAPVHTGMWHPVKWLVTPEKKPSANSTAEPNNAAGISREISQSYVDKIRNSLTVKAGPNWRHVEPGGLKFYNMGEILQWLVHRQGYTSYLELTAEQTPYFPAILSPTKHRLDVSLEGYADYGKESATSAYLESGSRYDLVIVDGCREQEAVMNDLRMALGIVSENGMVFCFGPLKLGNESEDSNQIQETLIRIGQEFPKYQMFVCRMGADIGIIQVNGATGGVTDTKRPSAADINTLDPSNLCAALFPWNSPEQLLTVITLWDGKWTPEQKDLLEWYIVEPFPLHTHFVWAVPAESEAETALESSWPEIESKQGDCSLELVVVPDLQQHPELTKHQLKAEVYSEVIRSMSSRFTLFVGNEILPTHSATKRLLDGLGNLPEEAVSLAGVFRSRARPDTICAGNAEGVYLRWDACSNEDILKVDWSGDGFALYKTEPLNCLLPLISDTKKGITGWEFVTSEKLRQMGKSFFIDCELRLENKCREAQLYQDRNKQ